MASSCNEQVSNEQLGQAQMPTGRTRERPTTKRTTQHNKDENNNTTNDEQSRGKDQTNIAQPLSGGDPQAQPCEPPPRPGPACNSPWRHASGWDPVHFPARGWCCCCCCCCCCCFLAFRCYTRLVRDELMSPAKMQQIQKQTIRLADRRAAP